MKVEEIKLAFEKNIKLSVGGNVSGYIQLPAGVHTIGDKKYTVSDYVENEGTENEYRTTKIDLIEPITNETPVV